MRAKTRESLEAELKRLEASFKSLLVAALERCANGAWGLFGQNDWITEANPNLKSLHRSADAEELIEMASEIKRVRDILGYTESYALCDRFSQYRAMKGANVPGEPKLAKQFLSDISADK